MTPARRRRTIVTATIVAILTCAALVTAAAFWQSGARSDSKDASLSKPAAPPTPLAIPTPTPHPLGDQDASAKAAHAALTAMVAADNEILQRGDGGTAGLDRVAAGFVWGELQAQATERAQLGYKQVGKAKITSATIRSVDLAASPPTVVLDVCIDASGISVVDQNGHSLDDLLYKPGHPTLNVYGAQYIDGLWKIVTHDIPDSAACA